MKKIVCTLAIPWMLTNLAVFSLAQYGGGTGTAEDPYQIWTAEQMNEIGLHEQDWDKHFILMADIDLSQYTGRQFHLIGKELYLTLDVPFSGVFEGNGKVISNFTYESEDEFVVGLFRGIDNGGIVRNLGLISPVITIQVTWDFIYDTGCLVATILTDGCLENCLVQGGAVNGSEWVGLLSGGNAGTIINCSATGSVFGERQVGGLCGGNEGTIENCFYGGSVTGTGGIGGLVGYNRGSIVNSRILGGSVQGTEYSIGGLVGGISNGVITNCYVNVNVSGGQYVGGLIGSAFYDGPPKPCISKCSSFGTVEGRRYIGGLVGNDIYGLITDSDSHMTIVGEEYIGGLVGRVDKSEISRSYFAGTVSGSQNVGGLAGYGYCLSVDRSFWDVEKSSVPNLTGDEFMLFIDEVSEGKSTDEMMKRQTFVGWDFVNVWDIGEGQTYPYLRQFSAGDLNKDHTVNLLDLAILAEQWMDSTEGS